MSEFDFPVMLDAGTRAFFEAMAVRQEPEVAHAINRMLSTNPPDAAAVALLSKSPDWNAAMRTTCVATMLEGGHAENALPQSAKATVNCRILPSQTPGDVEQTLRRVLSDDQISLTPIEPPGQVQSPPSPLRPEVVEAAKAGDVRHVAGRSGRALPVAGREPTAHICAAPESRPTGFQGSPKTMTTSARTARMSALRRRRFTKRASSCTGW